jgi:hypothetical protein
MGYYEYDEKGLKIFYFTAELFSELCKGFNPNSLKMLFIMLVCYKKIMQALFILKKPFLA